MMAGEWDYTISTKKDLLHFQALNITYLGFIELSIGILIEFVNKGKNVDPSCANKRCLLEFYYSRLSARIIFDLIEVACSI